MRTNLADLGRFSDPSLLILSSLASGPKHGYAMMEDIAQCSGTRLEPGTLYGALSRRERLLQAVSEAAAGCPECGGCLKVDHVEFPRRRDGPPSQGPPQAAGAQLSLPV